MREKKLGAFLLSLSWICTCLALPHYAKSLQLDDRAAKVYRDCSKSVLLLIVKSPEGEVVAQASGFIIAGRKVVTNNHVISKGQVFIQSGVAILPAALEKADIENDLAILRTDAFLSVNALTINEEIPSPGATVFTISSPIGLENSISTGVVASIRDFNGRRLIQITSPISPGSSGGPVLNERGEVIGVAVGQLNEGQNLNFAVPSVMLTKLIRSEETTDEGVAALLERIFSLQTELSKMTYSSDVNSDFMKLSAQIRTLLLSALNRIGDDPSQYARLSELAEFQESDIAIAAAERAVRIAATVETNFRLGSVLKTACLFAEEDKSPELLGRAEVAFRACLRLTKEPTAEIVIELADILESRGAYADAEIYFKQALILCMNPLNVEVRSRCLRGLENVSYALGKHNESNSFFKMLVDNGDASGFDWRTHASHLEENKKYHEAGLCYQQAATILGKWGWQNWLSAARMFYFNENDYDAALNCARKTISIGSGKKGAEREMGLAYRIIADILNSRGVYQEALNHAKESIAIYSEDPWSHYEEGRALIGLRRFMAATSAILQAIRLSDGKFSLMHFSLGSAYFELENWQLAKQSFEKGSELDPNDTAGPYNIALCLIHLSYYLDAAKWFEEVLRRNPNHPQRQEILQKIQTLRR